MNPTGLTIGSHVTESDLSKPIWASPRFEITTIFAISLFPVDKRSEQCTSTQCAKLGRYHTEPVQPVKKAKYQSHSCENVSMDMLSCRRAVLLDLWGTKALDEAGSDGLWRHMELDRLLLYAGSLPIILLVSTAYRCCQLISVTIPHLTLSKSVILNVFSIASHRSCRRR